MAGFVDRCALNVAWNVVVAEGSFGSREGASEPSWPRPDVEPDCRFASSLTGSDAQQGSVPEKSSVLRSLEVHLLWTWYPGWRSAGAFGHFSRRGALA